MAESNRGKDANRDPITARQGRIPLGTAGGAFSQAVRPAE
jgi:hypothetical protein